MSKNEKDLKAELMELINGEHKKTNSKYFIPIFENGDLIDIIDADAFILPFFNDDFTSFCSGGGCYDAMYLSKVADYYVLGKYNECIIDDEGD